MAKISEKFKRERERERPKAPNKRRSEIDERAASLVMEWKIALMGGMSYIVTKQS